MDRSTRIGWAALTLVLLSLASAAPQTLNLDNLNGTLPAGTTTLTGTVTITGSVTVPANANVVVAAGTTIRLRDYYLSILVKGGFTANGTATNPVTITSIEDSGTDQWGGIQYQKGSTGSLTQVRFRYGGGYPVAMVVIDSARVNISNCTFTSSGEDGIRVSNIADPTWVSISNCTFARNNSDGIQCDDASPTVRACSFTGDGGALHLTGTSFPVFGGDLTSNGPPIWVDGTTLSRSGTWAYAGVPYAVTGNVTVPAGVALTVAPGVVVKITDYYTRFLVYGDLSVPGTTAAPVSFTTYQDDTGGDTNRDGTDSTPIPDQWGGLIYFKGATGTLSQARFAYGGGYSDAMVDIDSARVSLTGCSFFRSGEDGIRVRNVPSPSLVSIVGCSFTRNSDGIECNNASPSVRAATFSGGGNAMRLTGTSYPAFVGDLTTDAPGIWIDGATMATSGTWSYAGIAYVLSGNVTVPADVTLTVAPGVVIKVTSYYDRAFVYGRLDAPGTATAPVTFTSYQDDTAGDTNRDGADSVPGPDQWGGRDLLPRCGRHVDPYAVRLRRRVFAGHGGSRQCPRHPQQLHLPRQQRRRAVRAHGQRPDLGIGGQLYLQREQWRRHRVQRWLAHRARLGLCRGRQCHAPDRH